MNKIGPDDELSLYKVTYLGQEQYCVGINLEDVVSGYEDKHELTKIEYFDTTYLSPGILKGK